MEFLLRRHACWAGSVASTGRGGLAGARPRAETFGLLIERYLAHYPPEVRLSLQRVRASASACVCVRARVCVCVCVCARARARVRLCVCRISRCTYAEYLRAVCTARGCACAGGGPRATRAAAPPRVPTRATQTAAPRTVRRASYACVLYALFRVDFTSSRPLYMLHIVFHVYTAASHARTRGASVRA